MCHIGCEWIWPSSEFYQTKSNFRWLAHRCCDSIQTPRCSLFVRPIRWFMLWNQSLCSKLQIDDIQYEIECGKCTISQIPIFCSDIRNDCAINISFVLFSSLQWLCFLELWPTPLRLLSTSKCVNSNEFQSIYHFCKNVVESMWWNIYGYYFVFVRISMGKKGSYMMNEKTHTTKATLRHIWLIVGVRRVQWNIGVKREKLTRKLEMERKRARNSKSRSHRTYRTK